MAEQSLSATRDFAENFIARILLFGSHAEIDGHPSADSILKKIWYVVARKVENDPSRRTLSEVLTTITRLIEAPSEGMLLHQ